MIRRILNNVIEQTLPQTVEQVHPNPFTTKDTLNFGWLANISPCFPIRSSNIAILKEPHEFYETLLSLTKGAKSRITLASLYFGNGKLEQKLVDAVLENERFRNQELRVNILLDYTRGSRFKVNSRTLLQPLLQKNENCKISLYHTPILRGFLKKYTPNRYNELFGLQHMKLYIFDDTLVITGANLSNDYFTNRQDRYFVIKDKKLCDFYCGLVQKVQTFSLLMDRENKVTLHENWGCSPYEGNKQDFLEKAEDLVEKYVSGAKNELNNHKTEGYDTWIFPLIQMGQLGVDQDSAATLKLLAEAPQGSELYLATGYFNLTKQYMNTLIQDSAAKCHILMAHPKANGFLGASGIAGGIPFAYSLIAHIFKQKTEQYSQDSRIILQEYLREKWTYHAKGLWYNPPKSDLPCLTLVGSPNFGERSVNRDLETQIAIVTENTELRKKIKKERDRLYKMGLPADTNRKVPLWVYAFVYLFGNYF